MNNITEFLMECEALTGKELSDAEVEALLKVWEELQ